MVAATRQAGLGLLLGQGKQRLPSGHKMPTSRIVTMLSIAAVLTCSGHAQDGASDLGAIERERIRSLVEGDLETARRLHADDFQLVTPAGATQSREEYLGEIASGKLDYLIWEPETIEVRAYREAAVIRYRAQAQAVAAGRKTPLLRFWHTDVYEKRNGRWQAVWSQATLIQ